MARRYDFKTIDQRTGRLERACKLLEDGEKARIKTREPDGVHPLSRPISIGMDRAQILKPKKRFDADLALTHVVGLSGSLAEPWATRGSVAFALYSGGCIVSTVEQTYYITFGDGVSRILLGDGASALVQE